MTTKITLVSRRDVDFTGQKGEQITGFMYLGFLPNGKAIEFFSKDGQKPILEGGIEFDPSTIAEVYLEPRLGKQGIKYREKLDF